MNAMIGSSLLLADEGYQISRSVRLRSSASAYFNRTPGSVTNRRTMTFSFWMKRGLLTYSANYLSLFTAYPGTSAIDQIAFSPSSDSLRVWFNGSASADLITTQVFRDPSAWYHIVVAIDTTQATASNRIKVYANGSQITSFSTATYPALNYDTYWNSSSYASAIGANLNGPQGYFDGYLTEVNFIDGQALTPSSFGETNPVTGVWQPKKYAGTYGTNGFYLNFSDNSAATAAAIGKDYSGNGNNWTPNNISVTAGVTYDSMLDVPTQWADGGNGRGNYAVMNPLTYGGTIDNGNLEIVSLASYSSSRGGTSTIAADGGKFYWEATKLSGSSTDLSIGICTDANFIAGAGNRFYYDSTGNYSQNGSVVSTAPATYATNDIIGLAVDATTSAIEFFKNGVSQGSYTMSFAGPYFAQIIDGTSAAQARFAINFGQRPFAYTPPTGFKALNTLNLPTPTILKGNQYMNVLTWSGTGGSAGATRSLTGLGFQPDFVWEKDRASAQDHHLFDSVRGAGTNKTLASNSTGAEGGFNDTLYGYLSSFDADGFTTTNGSSTWDNWNKSGDSYVAWCWKEGATQGFDIVTYTGDGANRTVAHNLGVAPKMVIVKKRNSATSSNWMVYHAGAGTGNALNLNGTSAAGGTYWNNTAPTSTVFSLDSNANYNNNTDTFVAYLFAEVAGFSKFGSYTGNGSADGPFVFCGFRPRWVLWKNASAVGDWQIKDSSRSTYNVTSANLYANLSNAENSAGDVDFLSNGFKLRSAGTDVNGSGNTIIYAAFAENPFKYSLAR